MLAGIPYEAYEKEKAKQYLLSFSNDKDFKLALFRLQRDKIRCQTLEEEEKHINEPVTSLHDVHIFFLAPYSAILVGETPAGKEWLKENGKKLNPDYLGKTPENMQSFIERLADYRLAVKVHDTVCVISAKDKHKF